LPFNVPGNGYDGFCGGELQRFCSSKIYRKTLLNGLEELPYKKAFCSYWWVLWGAESLGNDGLTSEPLETHILIPVASD